MRICVRESNIGLPARPLEGRPLLGRRGLGDGLALHPCVHEQDVLAQNKVTIVLLLFRFPASFWRSLSEGHYCTIVVPLPSLFRAQLLYLAASDDNLTFDLYDVIVRCTHFESMTDPFISKHTVQRHRCLLRSRFLGQAMLPPQVVSFGFLSCQIKFLP